MIGQSLLHYRILEKIGEGGMGVVYKALDTHLDRFVAVKVLPSEKVVDSEHKQRFVQEAKSASALNHPNIVIVHDFASDRSLDFIVMEYVEGQTLDQLIGRKGMKLNEALGYAVQITDGLARAHAAGIIHRDLKPTNIMVTPEGRVKILDFGLAKLTEDIRVEKLGTTATLVRPEKKPRTEEGFILGTVTYMSPEQAEGKKVDSRSDVFSFGSVLYEMLTGQRAFSRETRIATLAAIIREEPKPPMEINDALPSEVVQVLTRCLRKDPQRRWQTMSDLKVVFQDLKEDSESGKLRAARTETPPLRKRRFLLNAAGSFLIIVVATLLVWLLFFRTKPPAEFQISRLTYDSGLTTTPAISPDGKLFACASDRSGEGHLDIWVQQVSGGKPLRLTDHPADDGWPTFSPDGSKIVFQSRRDGGGIYIVDTLGGEARRIAEKGSHPRFSPDGSNVAYVEIPASLDSDLNKMYLISPQGGAPRPFQPEFALSNSDTCGSPVWSSDGKYIIFNGRRVGDPASQDWWVAPVDGGPAVRTGAKGNLPLPPIWQSPEAWEGEYIYYSTGTTVEGVNLFRVRINKRNWTVSGPAERITAGAGMQYGASVAHEGLILFSNSVYTDNIWSLQAKADLADAPGEPQQVTSDLSVKFDPSISRDGSKLAFLAFGGFQSTRFEVRLRDMLTGRERSFPSSALHFDQTPRISPDGAILSYQDFISGKLRTFLVSRDAASGRELCESCPILGFFTNPNFAVVQSGPHELERIDLSSQQRFPILEVSAGQIADAVVSPDDRWLCFLIGESNGRAAIYVAPLGKRTASEKDWVLVAEDIRFLGSPQWSPNGNLLYYLSERDGHCCIWAQRLDPAGKKPIGEAIGVYHAHKSRFNLNVTGDGAVRVTTDKLVFLMSEMSGNIYSALAKRR